MSPTEYARVGGPWDVAPLSSLVPAGIVDGSISLDPDEVDRRADLVAAGLATRGVRRGDVVAWQLPNWWEASVLFHACWRIGAIAAPIHHRGGEALLTEVTSRLHPRVTLVAGDAPDDAIEVRGDGDGFGRLLDGAARGHPSRVHAVGPEPADTAVILATSGSTGRPKLVRHTHRALAYKARTMITAHGLSAADTVLMPAPLAHISGLLNGVLLPAAAAMTTVLLDRWDPDRALDFIAAERVSFMIGPPTFFIDLQRAETFRPAAVDSLRLISCGGAGVTPSFALEAMDTFGATVKRTYGSTEAPTVTTSHAGDSPTAAVQTDGRPVGAAEVRLRDAADGVGTLMVRGPELFDSYLDDPDPRDDEGWFPTGDLARIDNGWVTILGRADDTILRGGENISPAEVEAACARLPGVRHAVVLGFADERLGQRVGLVLEADRDVTVAEVASACAEAGLAPFKTPERVVCVSEVPRLPAGKPDRQAVARLLVFP